MGYMHIGNMGEAQRLIRESSEREDALREEIARLRAALKPFADLSSVYVRRAETFGWEDTASVFGVADITRDVTIRVSDCRAALKALG